MTSEVTIAASSRIKDAAIATESSEVTRLAILRESVTAVPAQENVQPELALTLLDIS